MFKRIWAIGDIHGSYHPIENFWRKNRENIIFSKEDDCIILLGDVGANYFFNKRDKHFKEKLESFPFTYFCVRGNHEARPSVCATKDPEHWHKKQLFEESVWVEKDYPNIRYAMDYPCTYNISCSDEHFKTLVIPGAYSVDKYYRLSQGWSWFEDEQLSQEEMDLGREIIKQNPAFDLILSHTCPLTYEPTDLFLSGLDQSLVDKTMERYLGEIEYNTEYKLHLFGHFHDFRIYPKHNDKQTIMLFNKEVFNIIEYFKTLNPYQCLY
jgi:3-oxoacid CoA-transferase subunit A